MDKMTFAQFLTETMRLFSAGDYAAALQAVQAQGGLYPEYRAVVYNLHYCLLALSGEPAQAIQVLQEAVDQGLWWPEAALRGDPGMDSLQGQEQFERLVSICAERHRVIQQAARPERLVIPPAAHTRPPYPTLIAFHPRGSSAADFAPDWEYLAGRGWLVMLPQSSQVRGLDAFCWDDTALAEKEAREHFAALAGQYAIDRQRVLLAGFSQGGGLAAWLAASQSIPARGIFVIAPYLRSVDALLGLPTPQVPAPVRGYLITGDLDRDEGLFDKLETLLARYSICYQRHRYPDLAHEMPSDMHASLQKALEFIFAEE
jgi:predicted esterase